MRRQGHLKAPFLPQVPPHIIVSAAGLQERLRMKPTHLHGRNIYKKSTERDV